MSRGAQEKARVRAAIVDALFDLMAEKDLSKVTVSDIVSRAGVARMSFYRNFESKEEVIEEYVDAVYRGLEEKGGCDPGGFPTTPQGLEKRFEGSFDYLLGQRDRVLALYRAGHGTLVLDAMNRQAEEAFGDMPSASPSRYGIYLATGAAFNVLIRWLEGGARETPAELAKTCTRFLFSRSHCQ